MASHQTRPDIFEEYKSVEDETLILATEENPNFFLKLCSHQEETKSILEKMATLEAKKINTIDEIHRSQKNLDDFQNFYEEYGSFNRDSVICELAENECNLQWERHNSMLEKLKKLNDGISNCLEETEQLTDLARKEKCSCVN